MTEEVINGLNTETGIFTFEGLNEGGYIEVHLSPTERDMIRPYGAPGQPIWKIQKGMLDYRAVLAENAITLDLTKPEELEKARSLFAEIKAIDWQYRMWERILGAPELMNQDPNDPNVPST